ncbi:hypothetical protein GQ43DRAFT_199517 [Delitschia confertaspora ATCC 74209]|uniref:Uncharacterized protein n=1 Tax=Delitschia confertaspora ATCC 74209 TaxID=1513339 RepID=A0A9P4JJ25_9PLEO|nr:hypothetical protein GQ43DRAFT_199517 [Delitschia confertaspora ATCC 74209]
MATERKWFSEFTWLLWHAIIVGKRVFSVKVTAGEALWWDGLVIWPDFISRVFWADMYIFPTPHTNPYSSHLSSLISPAPFGISFPESDEMTHLV